MTLWFVPVRPLELCDEEVVLVVLLRHKRGLRDQSHVELKKGPKGSKPGGIVEPKKKD